MRTATLVLAMLSAASANDYWVGPQGNDANPGTQAQPFRQISRAITVAGAGDTVHVLDGTYAGGLVIQKTGTAAAPFVVKAEGSGVVVSPGGTDTIFVTYSAYVVLEGLRSFNANRAAVRIDNSHHVTVRNGVFGNNARWGIFTDFSDDLLLENNECYGSGLEHGIYVSNSGDRPVVRGNVAHGNNACGIQLNADLSMGGDGTISDAVIERNVVYGNGAGGGAAINLDGVATSVIRNNLLYDNHANGITLFQIDGALASSNNAVVNNTIEVASDGRWAIHVGAGASGNVIFNNILLTKHASRGSLHFEDLASSTGTVSDYNVFTVNPNAVTADDDASYLTLTQWKAMGYDAHSFASTPGAVYGGDHRLIAGSPAIDAGVGALGGKIAPTDDLDGGARTDGALDVGADEVGAGSAPAPAAPANETGGGGGGGCGMVGLEALLVLALLSRRQRLARLLRVSVVPGCSGPGSRSLIARDGR
ncbi:MAG: right-handed parallel beta-helix repeat-containing protein [Planctomycetes bacterium]|nr:right-handed parallel beta-helix repeat-containing protein [Planctomycetota bacterium]